MQISVRVTAGAKKELIEILPKNRIQISVKAKAQLGAANERALELVAKYFKVPRKKVRILRGVKTPSKIILIGE